MRHIHLCDPQLRSAEGHYLNHDAQLVRELQKRELPVTIYSRRHATVTCEGLTPEPVFTHDIFAEATSDAQVWAIENFNTINQLFLNDLLGISPDRFSSDDLVYFPNLLQNQLYAVALWLGHLPAERRPAVAIMLRWLNQGMDYVQARANKELIALYYRYAGRALHAVQPRSVICADTRELAMAYQKIMALPVLELPNPMDVSALPAPAVIRSVTARPLIVYLGSTSPLRGMHFLPEIIEYCAKFNPRPRFVIQVQSRETALSSNLGPTIERLDRLAGDDVRIVNGTLSPADYFSLLAEADVVLLPYSPTFYGYGSSGIFTEAASLGKVIMLSPGTVPARQGREFKLGVVTATQWTPAAAANAVAQILRDLPALQARATRAAPLFRAAQCALVFWDKLFAAIPAVAKPPTDQATFQQPAKVG
jgi:glycosyltransferase involved in cell wall biosynthesis